MRFTWKDTMLRRLLQVGKDPFSARAKRLNGRARAVHAKIQQLEKEVVEAPRYRSTVLGQAGERAAPEARLLMESTFETVEHESLYSKQDQMDPTAHYNALGLRKLDPMGWFRRQGRQSSNLPREETADKTSHQWVRYMATGGVQGMEPLGREKRIARNRFLMMFVVFLAILCGIFAVM